MAETFSNQLTDAEAERLAILAEEMGEAIQAIGKILRHGYESFNPDIPFLGWTNRHELQKELGDVSAAMEMMCNAHDVSATQINIRAANKLQKIKPYLHHQPAAPQESEDKK